MGGLCQLRSFVARLFKAANFDVLFFDSTRKLRSIPSPPTTTNHLASDHTITFAPPSLAGFYTTWFAQLPQCGSGSHLELHPQSSLLVAPPPPSLAASMLLTVASAPRVPHSQSLSKPSKLNFARTENSKKTCVNSPET